MRYKTYLAIAGYIRDNYPIIKIYVFTKRGSEDIKLDYN